MDGYNDQPNNREPREHDVSHPILFWTFFRIGLLTLGGGLAMATVMRHSWC